MASRPEPGQTCVLHPRMLSCYQNRDGHTVTVLEVMPGGSVGATSVGPRCSAKLPAGGETDWLVRVRDECDGEELRVRASELEVVKK